MWECVSKVYSLANFFKLHCQNNVSYMSGEQRDAVVYCEGVCINRDAIMSSLVAIQIGETPGIGDVDCVVCGFQTQAP